MLPRKSLKKDLRSIHCFRKNKVTTLPAEGNFRKVEESVGSEEKRA